MESVHHIVAGKDLVAFHHTDSEAAFVVSTLAGDMLALGRGKLVLLDVGVVEWPCVVELRREAGKGALLPV